MGVDVVIVAVDASKEITDYALEWAIRNVIHPMDSLILLALLPSHGHGNRAHQSGIQQFFSCLLKKFQTNKDSSSDHVGLVNGANQDKRQRITEVCVQMIRQLCFGNDIKQVQTQVYVVPDAQMGTVAEKAVELRATWVILDRRLKKEGDCCLEQLNCNILLIDHAIPKVLQTANSDTMKRINVGVQQKDPTFADMLGVFPSDDLDSESLTTSSSLGLNSQSQQTSNSHSLSNRDKQNAHRTTNTPNTESTKRFPRQYPQFVPQEMVAEVRYRSSSSSYSQPLRKVSVEMNESPRIIPTRGRTKSHSGLLKSELPPVAQIPTRRSTDTPRLRRNSIRPLEGKQNTSSRRSLQEGNNIDVNMAPSSPLVDRTSSIRKVMSLSIKQPPTPPPLCSVCKYNAPIFGKAPRKFSYEEIERATSGFSSPNFLAEGGYGLVFRGVMPDGQVVAVKQHKLVTAQGASEFCSEVEVLSCAQHRNLVMLVGYCTEPEWLLVYEFACNGSLDQHLYETEENEVISWHNRMKVAIGAARGLRYLHEDCRVGCIVHRDLRPKNILLTHDFEPMVGDFGLARWQADGQSAEETRVVGAFGYLAPEYTQTGQITEKADVYAFGVVLLELLSGMKATDLSRNEDQHYQPDWGRTLLENRIPSNIIDPRLGGNYTDKEVESMMYAASLCISPHPKRRPRMSQVLRILEGDKSGDIGYQHADSPTTLLEHRRKNSYAAGTSSIQNQQMQDLIGPVHHINLPSSHSGSERGHSENMVTAPRTSLVKYREERQQSISSKNHTEESFSQEYDTYLQGSLQEFIHNIK